MKNRPKKETPDHLGSDHPRNRTKSRYVSTSIVLALLLALLVVFVVARKKEVKREGKGIRRAIPPARQKIKREIPKERKAIRKTEPLASAPQPLPPLQPIVVAKGRLFVDTKPAEATVMVLNVMPKYHRGMELKEDRYHIQVSHPGYKRQRRWVEVKAKRDNAFSVELDRIVTTGTILVRSKPPGAEWFLNGRLQGTTPDSKEDIQKGRYGILIRKDGHEHWSKTVTIKPKRKVVIQAKLSKIRPRPGVKWRENATGMVFVWVPEGCFEMGSPPSETGRDPDEGPTHKVCVDGFWIGMTEVTNAQYLDFRPAHDSKASNGHSLNDNSQPVVYVSWEDAVAFGRWLTDQNDGPYEFRLPTEAEWEYACRAGSKTARFWGEDVKDTCKYANVYDQSSKRANKFKWRHHECDDGVILTSPVASFHPNDFGLYDMLGNVWEWCEDIYGKDAYSEHQRKNPLFERRGAYRVNRGGSWTDIPRGVRSAIRERLDPKFGNFCLGFRLVRTP